MQPDDLFPAGLPVAGVVRLAGDLIEQVRTPPVRPADEVDL